MVSRRTLLFSSLGIAACSACSAGARESASSPSADVSSTPSQAVSSAGSTPTATSSSPTPAPATPSPSATGPTREQVIAEFSGKKPTEWGLHSTGTVNRGSAAAARKGLVALTFDACGGHGGSGYDAALIALLRKLEVPATLTLNARWIQENESTARNLGADPLFEIQSHGNRHLPLSVSGQVAYGSTGTKSVAEVYDELTSGTAAIQAVAQHNTVSVMRPGTAYCDDVAARIGRRIGMPVLDFSINGDWGTTATARQIVENLAPVAGGDIVIAHMNHPEHDTAEGYARALPGLLRRGVKFAHVSDVLSA